MELSVKIEKYRNNFRVLNSTDSPDNALAVELVVINEDKFVGEDCTFWRKPSLEFILTCGVSCRPQLKSNVNETVWDFNKRRIRNFLSCCSHISYFSTCQRFKSIKVINLAA